MPSTSANGITQFPNETAGPYPGDGSNGADVLEQSGVVRGDIRPNFGDDGGKYELATVKGDVGSGYTVSLSGGVDASG